MEIWKCMEYGNTICTKELFQQQKMKKATNNPLYFIGIELQSHYN